MQNLYDSQIMKTIHLIPKYNSLIKKKLIENLFVMFNHESGKLQANKFIYFKYLSLRIRCNSKKKNDIIDSSLYYKNALFRKKF